MHNVMLAKMVSAERHCGFPVLWSDLVIRSFRVKLSVVLACFEAFCEKKRRKQEIMKEKVRRKL